MMNNTDIRTVIDNTVCSFSINRQQKFSRRNIKEEELRCIFKRQCTNPIEIPAVWSEFRENCQLCDGIILCDDGVEFKIHRLILSTVSPYFKAHFTNCLSSGSSGNTKATVNVSSQVFKKILDFVYTGNCDIDDSTVEFLFKAADQYHILCLVQFCCRYILDQLDPVNCLGILRFARCYFCKDLEEEVQCFIKYNFVQLLHEGHEFQELTIDEVLELLSDDELNVKNEGLVYEAIRLWVVANLEERKRHLPTLLKCIRLGNLTDEFLIKHMIKWKPLSENQECCQYLTEILNVMDTSLRKSFDFNHILWKPRIPYDIIFAIGGWNAESSTNFIETYDTRADKWLLSSYTDNIPRAYHGLCALNGYIYMIGGFDGNEHFNTVKCFDPINHKWNECACMNYPRSYVSVAVHNSKIYAMGGYNGRTRTNSAERYDPRINQWELIRPMQKRRSDASAAALKDKIYVVGGFNGFELMNSAEVYDPINNQWTFIPHMLSMRSGVSLIAFRNTLYALGGFDGHTRLATGEKFKPGMSSKWIEIATMSNSRSNFTTVALDNVIFVIGGFNGSTTINCVECYDADMDRWSRVSPTNLNRSALGACVLSGLPNTRDYSFNGRNDNKIGQGAGVQQDISEN